MNGRIIGAAALACGLLLVGCGSPPRPPPLDSELKRVSGLAESAYAGGQIGRAVAGYRKALARARAMDDPTQIGLMAYNLAACLAAEHRYDQAGVLLEEARIEFERAGRDTSEVALLKARIARFQGSLDEAKAVALQAIQNSKGMNALRLLQFHILLAQVYCGQGDMIRARAEWAAIEPLLRNVSLPAIQAEARLVQAEMLRSQGKHAEAAFVLDAAAERLRAAGRYRDMALTLQDAGRAWEQVGDIGAAADRYFRAARSLFGAGDYAAARELVKTAVPLAAKSGAPDTAAALERLHAEIATTADLPVAATP